MNKGVTERTAASDARYRQLQLLKKEKKFSFQSRAHCIIRGDITYCDKSCAIRIILRCEKPPSSLVTSATTFSNQVDR